MAKTPAYRRVADFLERAIRSGKIPAGAVIKVADVAALFDSSRSPVRMAFGQLEAQGLLTPHDGHQGHIVGRNGALRRITLTPEMLAIDDDISAAGAAQKLYFEVEHSLILHSIGSPQRVNELAMARHFRTDRRTVRELLLRAQSMGIVDRQAGRWEIVPFDAERCSNLYEMRMLLEPVALEGAAGRIPPAELQGVRQRLISARENQARLSVEDVDMLEADMHRNVLSFCPNREIPEALRRTIPTYVCGKYIQFILRQKNEALAARHTNFDIVDTFLTDHLEVLDLMRGGRVGMAAAALHAHLARSRLQIIDMLSDYHVLHDKPLPPPIFD